uniref:Uncharacterized protein n=1 Tax=Anguilla anguilla TaxID=7936 RepID=A0A0E9TUN8_ANGAN
MQANTFTSCRAPISRSRRETHTQRSGAAETMRGMTFLLAPCYQSKTKYM